MPKALLALLLLTGCATYSWEKTGATPEQRYTDSAECHNDAAVRYPDFGYIGPQVYGHPLLGRPMYFDADPNHSLELEFRRDQILRSCMTARGYKLQRVEPAKGK